MQQYGYVHETTQPSALKLALVTICSLVVGVAIGSAVSAQAPATTNLLMTTLPPTRVVSHGYAIRPPSYLRAQERKQELPSAGKGFGSAEPKPEPEPENDSAEATTEEIKQEEVIDVPLGDMANPAKMGAVAAAEPSFWQGVQDEAGRIDWPSIPEALRRTILVLTITFGATVVVTGMNFLFNSASQSIFYTK